MMRFIRKWPLIGFFALALWVTGHAEAMTFKSIVVFGGSVSDSGNFFALTGISSRPPYDDLDFLLIPSGSYSKGGNHFSNGATWVEQYAKPRGLGKSVLPAFRGAGRQATNYAVGGARAREVGITINMDFQVEAFLSDHGNVAPSDALYVIDFGGNDVRDALVSADPPGVITEALGSISDNLAILYAAGARKFLFLNVADIGTLPSVRILHSLFPGTAAGATALTHAFNAGLDFIISSMPLDVEVALLDVFQLVEDLVAHPGDYGLTEVANACVTPNVRPFSCKKPDQYLFWDGIHPTKAVQAIFAAQAANVLGQ
jgi:phospholipase/lecithinase/hemolysin